MFCYQCEQTSGGSGCTRQGVCGKNEDIRVGPSAPAFISPNVFKVLQDKFGLKLITDPDSDLKQILGK